MVGFNLSAEERDKLVAEYEAQAEVNAISPIAPVKHSANGEGAEADVKPAKKDK